MHAVDTLIEGRTVLLISHRLSTLGRIDEIAVLHEGRIVERGDYSMLCNAGGRFEHMLKEQRRYQPASDMNIEPGYESQLPHDEPTRDPRMSPSMVESRAVRRSMPSTIGREPSAVRVGHNRHQIVARDEP